MVSRLSRIFSSPKTKKGRELLHLLAMKYPSPEETKEQMEKIHRLVEEGASLKVKDPSTGWTALMLAIGHHHLEDIALAMIGKGADIHAAETQNGWTPFHYAAIAGMEKVLDVLLKKGCDIDVKDGDGHTALMWAVWLDNGHATARKLVGMGASCDAAAISGTSIADLIEDRGFPQKEPELYEMIRCKIDEPLRLEREREAKVLAALEAPILLDALRDLPPPRPLTFKRK